MRDNKEKIIGIYRLFNTTSNKSYIGSSIDIEARRFCHFSLLRRGKSHSSKLQNAFNKYGIESFKFEILELCAVEYLENKEIYWIEISNSVKDGYNTSIDVKCPTRGFRHSIETRNRMSIAQRALKRSPESIKHSSDVITNYNRSLKGIPKKESHKKKISEANMGRVPSKESIQKSISTRKTNNKPYYWTGKKRSAECIEKFRTSHLGVVGGHRPIIQLDLFGNEINRFKSTAEASRFLNIKRTSIKNNLRGYCSIVDKKFKFDYVSDKL